MSEDELQDYLMAWNPDVVLDYDGDYIEDAEVIEIEVTEVGLG
jgi:hypothetical protein